MPYRTLPANNHGVTMMEVLVVMSCLGFLWASSAATLERLAASAASLETHTQAVLAAEAVLELRRATGRFPPPAEQDRLLAALGRGRHPRLSAREERYRGTGLAKVTVTVAWRGQGSSESEVKLVSLARVGK